MGDAHEWDSRVPESLGDVVSLLRRRIKVHKNWLKWIRASGSNALAAQRSGIGSVETHTVYIKQYEAAVVVMEEMFDA